MANPETAWHDAEKIVFDKLCTDTKSKEGASAWRAAELPDGIYECWRLDTGGGDAQQTWGGCFGSLVIGGTIEGRFKDRAKAQSFIGRIMQTLNETTNFKQMAGTNIQWFRIGQGGMPTITSDTFTPANGKGRVLDCHIVTMGVQLVYNLSTEY